MVKIAPTGYLKREREREKSLIGFLSRKCNDHYFAQMGIEQSCFSRGRKNDGNGHNGLDGKYSKT